MKLLEKKPLRYPINAHPGDTVIVTYSKDGKQYEVAKAAITRDMTFDTAFVAELEEGELGFHSGIIGGMALDQ
jgi:hypothetical protein